MEDKLDPLFTSTIEQIKNHKAIRYVGLQNDVRPYLAASDALVFPSYREGFPNVVLEAGAMGLPSIVTNINGSNEIIIPDENGVIISVRDEEAIFRAMKFFVETPDEVNSMARKARELVASRYEQNLIWSALLKEYKYLIKNGCQHNK